MFVVVASILVHLRVYLQPQNYKLGHQIVLVHLCLWLSHMCVYLQPQNYKLGHRIVLVHLCLWLLHQVNCDNMLEH